MGFNAKTKIYLLIGYPLNYSLSPALYNAGFNALKLNCAYLASPVQPDAIGAAIKGLNALSIAGANITNPHKKAVIPFIDQVSHESQLVNSVNTIINHDGILCGKTTDGPGFLKSLQEVVPEYGKLHQVVIIGAGGAARPIAYTLAHNGFSEILILNRSVDKAESISTLIRSNTPVRKCSILSLNQENLHDALSYSQLIIYCLPIDSADFLTAVKKGGKRINHSILFDLRYNPAQTAVMTAFKKQGGRVFNGLGMLFWQAVFAFEYFSGKKAPVMEMRSIIKKEIGGGLN